MKRFGMFLLSTLFASALFLGACGEEEHALPEVDCATATVPTFAEVTLLASCVTCHNSAFEGAARNNAPVGIDYDNWTDAATHAEHGAAEVYAGEMPPLGNPPEADKQAFYTWALCGTPQ